MLYFKLALEVFFLINLKKCQFYQNIIHFLKYVISFNRLNIELE